MTSPTGSGVTLVRPWHFPLGEDCDPLTAPRLRQSQKACTSSCLRDFQQINYPILWSGHLCPLLATGPRVAHPTRSN
ncbi:MAG: hypothetical protein ACYTXA_16630 [Nostoc sp.]